MRQFIIRFGREVTRRPLSQARIDDLVTSAIALAGDAGDFNTGVEVVVAALLQDPRFIYRLETGSPVESKYSGEDNSGAPTTS